MTSDDLNSGAADAWQTVTAGEVGRFRGGSGFPLRFQGQTSGEIPFFKVSDMNLAGNEKRMTRANHYISEVVRKQLGATLFPAGSIVFAKVGAAVFLERKRILAQPSCIDNNMAAFVLDQARADIEFVHQLLVTMRLADLVSATALPALNSSDLAAMPVSLPPLDCQIEIASVLERADDLIGKLDQLIAKKRDLKRAAMQQLLTGHRRLSGFSEPWGERALQSVVTRLEAGVSVRSVEGDVGSSDCFVLKTSAVADGNFDASERKPVIPADRGRVRCPVRAGTVLVSRMNTPDLVGEVGFVDRDHPNSFLPDRLWAASVPKGAVSARWLSYVLSSSEYKQRLRDVATGTSGSMKNISKGAFLGISVKVPTLDEQSAIAQVLSDMDAELVALEARSDKTRQLKQGMMQALLTGQIRLV